MVVRKYCGLEEDVEISEQMQIYLDSYNNYIEGHLPNYPNSILEQPYKWKMAITIIRNEINSAKKEIADKITRR